MRRADLQLLLQAMDGLGQAGERNRDRAAREKDREIMRELQERSLDLQDRNYQLRRDQFGFAMGEAERQRATSNPFRQTVEVMDAFHEISAEIEKALVDAEMAGDQVRMQELQGKRAAVQAQADAIWQKGEENGTLEPLVEVSLPSEDGRGSFKVKVPYSELPKYGLRLPSEGSSVSPQSLDQLRINELMQELQGSDGLEGRLASAERRAENPGWFRGMLPGGDSRRAAKVEQIRGRRDAVRGEITSLSGSGGSARGAASADTVVLARTPEEAEALPPGTPYRVPGSDRIFTR